ncbi:MAG: ABC transporter ATP-binding protein [Bacilli bacterium]|nr:ABC transporter ATP-binding protein [Bacilli bacterium]
MENDRYARLTKKYSDSFSNRDKKEFKLSNGADRAKAMSSHDKPKDLKTTIIKLLKYLSHEKMLLMIAISCAIINALTTLFGSYLLRPIINKYIYFGIEDINDKLEGLFYSLLLLAIIYIVNVVTQWLQQRIMLNVSQTTLKHLRSGLYHKIQCLPMSYFDNNSTGDTMSRFTNDVDTMGEMLNATLIQLISGMITIAGTVFLMIYTNWILGLITIIVTPLLTVINKTIIKKGRSAYSKQQRSLGMLNGFSEEIISGLKVVKVFNHEDIAIDEFEFLNKQLTDSQIKAQFNSGIMGPITHQLCNVIYAITACVGGILVINYGFDIGGLTISLNYTRQFNRPINEISMQMNTVFAALAGVERVFEVLDKDSENDYLGER